LDLLEFSACPSPALRATPQLFSRFWKFCNEWHAQMPAFVAKLKPIAVISSSASYPSPTTNAQWVSAYAKAFSDVAPPTAVRIVIGSTPWLVTSGPACLATHKTNISQCNFTYGPQSPYAQILQRDQAVATAAKATLIPAVDLLCVQRRCPLVIQNHIVYRDDHHIYESYARVIGPLIAAQIHLPR
jgi:hypothetical protein